MWEKFTEILQDSTLFSILVSAIVVLMIIFCIITLYSKAHEEKNVEERRWTKVSADMGLYDKAKREVIPLEADEILIGRHGSADIRFSDMSVSRYHAVLYVSNGVWSVMDLNSKSGTYVNGKQIHTQKRLKDMDEICFGNKAVTIRQRRRQSHV